MKKDPFSKDKATNRSRFRNDLDVKTISDFKVTLSNMSKNQMEKMDIMQEQMGNFSRDVNYKKCQIQMCTI